MLALSRAVPPGPYMLTRVLLAIESPATRERLTSFLERQANVILEPLQDLTYAWERIGRMGGDLLIISRSLLPGAPAPALAALREVPDAPEVLVLATCEDPEDRARLLAGGFYAVLDESLDGDLLEQAVITLVARRREQAASTLPFAQRLDTPRLKDFVSASPAMQTFLAVAERVVESDTTLLLLGETGVGKERLARAIHAGSPRSSGPFIGVNCGAIPESLLESELFGHQEGAFTGATRARRGWFELAHQGTIFLDEIAEMPLSLQVKLLRVLQTREVYPVGAEKPVEVDVRVMAATNRELEEAVRAREFRSDLYYRLSVVTLAIPPLRERREDIPALVESYIAYFQTRFATSVTSIREDALDALREYSWPGNVRELINVVERAMLLCHHATIGLGELPEAIRRRISSPEGAPRGDAPGADLLPSDWLEQPLKQVRDAVVERLEQRYLRALLESTRGRIGETARRAGMNPRNLFDKMRQYGFRKEDFRSPRPDPPLPLKRP